MNVLLVFPQYPDSFWGFKHALHFISKKAAVPTLGLITVSAMLPESWQKRLVDMNVSALRTNDILWAPMIDHFILNEAEITLPSFLMDLESGHSLKKVYKTNKYADIKLTPVPDYHLLSLKDYAFMNLQVSGGFIVGFDSDTPAVFQRQIDFIQQSGIVAAMVGLLNAPRNTKLYKHLESENRLTTEATGNNTDSSMNFVSKMNTHELLAGYKNIIQNIYATKPYYTRIRQFLLNYKRAHGKQMKIEFFHIGAFIKSMFIIGILNKGRGEYWKLMFWTLFKKPGLIVDAITFAVYGYHFRIIYGLTRNR